MGKRLQVLQTRAMPPSRRTYIPRPTNLRRSTDLLLHNGVLLSLSSLRKALPLQPLHPGGTDRSLRSANLASRLSS